MKCPHCGQVHEDGAMVCPITTKPIAGYIPSQPEITSIIPNTGTNRSNKLIIPAIGVCIVVLLVIAFLLFKQRDSSTTTPVTTSVANEQATKPTEQPDLQTNPKYPSDWPDNFRFPDTFQLVEEANIGKITANSPVSYGAKLRFTGNTTTAAEQVTAFLVEQGWQIAMQSDVGQGGKLLMIRSVDGNEGGITIQSDSSNSEVSIVTAFFSLK